MQVEVLVQEEGLTGEREAWVRVLADELHDWPGIKDYLRSEDRFPDGFYDSPSRYYPHNVTTEEKAEHGFDFEEWFILAETQGGKARRERDA